MTRALGPVLVAFALGSAWLGAASIVSAVVAPAAFAVLPSRTLAGALVGRVLPVLFWSGMLIAAASMATTWSLPSRAARIAAGVTMLAACAAAQLIVSPRIERIRAAVSGPMDALATDDPQRLAFGRLHGISVGLLGLAAIAAFVGLVLLSRSLSSLREA
jgi:hypothetical protein